MIDNNTQKQIDAINLTSATQTQKDQLIAQVQQQADTQKQEIEKREQAVQKRQAIFDRAASITKIVQNTAEAITKAIAEFPLTAGEPFVAIDLALGAIQIGKVLAQPLPQFKTGTQSAPKGLALVGEEGRELVLNNSGEVFLTPHTPSLIELAGGERIFDAMETKDILKHYNMMDMIARVQQRVQPQPMRKNYDEKILRTLQMIEKKKAPNPRLELPIENTAWYWKHFKS